MSPRKQEKHPFSEPSEGAQFCFKLTDQSLQTRGGCQWVVGEWNPNGLRDGRGELCGPSWYHAYPWLDGVGDTLAQIRNPGDADITNPRLWVAEVRGIVKDAGDFCKIGATEQRLLYEVPLVPLTDDDCTALAIHIAGICDESDRDAEWDVWAEGWLSNRDRTEASAERAWASASAWARAWASAWASASASASAWASARASAWASAWGRARASAEAHQDFRDAIVAWRAGVGL